MILLDSNIIIYSINKASPKQNKAQKFIENNLNDLCASHQNILESIRVLTHSSFASPMKIKDASNAVWRIVESIRLISPTQKTIFLFRELVNKYPQNGNRIFDAYLVATAIANEVFAVATDNVRDFSIYKEIAIINPFK